MGYQVGESCYSTALQAAQATAAQNVGSFVARGADLYVVQRYSETASQIQYWMGGVGATTSFVQTVSFAPIPCGKIEWQDSLAMGWGIAAAWIVTAVIMNLRKAAHE